MGRTGRAPLERRAFVPLGGSWRPLSVHGEVVDPEVALFAREGTFIEGVLVGLLGQSPGLVLEHITTERRQPSCRPVPRLAVTIISW